ncbi:MAG: CrcB family protein [Halobacteriaceae archaeon]
MTLGPLAAALVAAGGAGGAVARHLVARAVDAGRYPAGTVVVNVVGSFLLGLLVAGGAGGRLTLLLGTGACGAFTTFSSTSYEVLSLWDGGDRLLATLHAAGTLLGAFAGLALAWLLVGAV